MWKIVIFMRPFFLSCLLLVLILIFLDKHKNVIFMNIDVLFTRLFLLESHKNVSYLCVHQIFLLPVQCVCFVYSFFDIIFLLSYVNIVCDDII
jgi:hypothetical protein